MGLPHCDEWDLSGLAPPRHSLLARSILFEEAIIEIAAEAAVIGARWERVDDRGATRGTGRAHFIVKLTAELIDLLHCGPDGLRGRYWQGESSGQEAERALIKALKPKLLIAASNESFWGRAAGDINKVNASLSAHSAKVWPREKDDLGNYFLRAPADSEGQLIVARWQKNEADIVERPAPWRRIPVGTDLDIKGAFISPAGQIFVPLAKQNRAQAIYRFGYT